MQEAAKAGVVQLDCNIPHIQPLYVSSTPMARDQGCQVTIVYMISYFTDFVFIVKGSTFIPPGSWGADYMRPSRRSDVLLFPLASPP